MPLANIFIACKSKEQRNKVIDIALKSGCHVFGKDEGFLNISIHSDHAVMDVSHSKSMVHKQKTMGFEQFMEKYGSNTMIEKINQAKKQLNFNNKQLSEALGYSRQYITKMLNLPQSEKIQDKVCKEIDVLLNREKFNPLSILPKPSEQRLDKLKKLSNVVVNAVENPIINEISVLRFQNNCKDKEITSLKKKLENNQIVINKLDDQLIRAEKVHNEDVKALNEAHSIIHVKNQRIEELEESAKSKDEDNTKLLNGLIMWKDDCNYAKDRIICERWLFIPLTLILLVMFIFK